MGSCKTYELCGTHNIVCLESGYQNPPNPQRSSTYEVTKVYALQPILSYSSFTSLFSRPYSWSRSYILLVPKLPLIAIYVHQNPRICCLISAWKLNTLGKRLRSRTAQINLIARHVELGAAG